jgi:hypothetical protein
MPDRGKPEIDEVVAYDDQDRDYLPVEAAVTWFYGRIDEEPPAGRPCASCTESSHFRSPPATRRSSIAPELLANLICELAGESR